MAISIPGFPRKNILKRNEDNIILGAAIVTVAVHVVLPAYRFVKGLMTSESDVVNEGARPFRKAA